MIIEEPLPRASASQNGPAKAEELIKDKGARVLQKTELETSVRAVAKKKNKGKQQKRVLTGL